MSNKTLSIVSYITIIGWLVAYFSGKNSADSLLKYHLRQSFGLFLTGLAFNFSIYFITALIPALSFLSYIGYALFALIIIGCMNAANEEKKPLPIIGSFFENQFAFIG